MTNLLILYSLDSLAHFNYILKEEMWNAKPAWNGQFCLEPQLIEQPKLICIYNTQPPFIGYVF